MLGVSGGRRERTCYITAIDGLRRDGVKGDSTFSSKTVPRLQHGFKPFAAFLLVSKAVTISL